MQFCRVLFFLLALFSLIGCGGGGGGDDSGQLPAQDNSTTQAPVAPTGLNAQTTTGQDQAVTIRWDAVSGAQSYNLYWGTSSGLEKSSATKVSSVTSPYIATGLGGGTPCWFALTAVNGGGESGLSAEVSATPRALVTVTGKLNDTGIDWFAGLGSNFLASEPEGYEGQDAALGRDALAAAGLLTKIGGGVAGFDFTKLVGDGNPLADQGADYATTPWDCVRDNVTSLIWEVKTDDGGLRDNNATYSWYSADPATNGGSDGFKGLGSCAGSIDCDTAAYVAAANAAELCGYNDWRLPAVGELRSIVDYAVANPGPTIDTDYFPNARNVGFWSASSFSGFPDYARVVYFDYAYDDIDIKSNSFDVRLVRGGQ